MNKNLSLIAGLCAASLFSASLQAEEKSDVVSPAWQQISPAWNAVGEKVTAFVGEDKQKKLINLAYASVAGELCEGISLDGKKFQSDFDQSFGEASLNPPKKGIELSKYGEQVAMYYGVYVGLLTSIGVQEAEAFCGAAKEKQAKGEDTYWTAVAAASKN